MLHKIKIVLLLILLASILIFGLLNKEPTEIDLAFTKVEISTTLLVFGTAAVGFISGSLMTGMWLHRRAKRARAIEAAKSQADA
ncbi:hypothetical protein FF011L_20510 [Roseimaritima multifibrata]|uniref:Lipopolysaccharide assembly protein A domain-containing protein n=1 Tax=Roseimaritima multifibrata TaxID=1930274 RepID=A0A517MEH7_9BACT|nr:lipopolysaccharide assembly protein LapA domain-containing protein [Roseimaritima multifibrata]QDS93289.1 hypothetical protein FF011L_20510 [Roseimaritima multifibrata]